MLDGAAAFSAASTFVKKEQDVPTVDLGTKLNSETFVESCKNIEDALNILYEKTRVLEELRDYTKSYVQQQIKEKRNRIADRLKVIERAADEYQNKDYTAYNVPFDSNLEVVKDRDGSILPQMINSVGRLEVGSGTLYTVPFQSATTGALQVEAELRDETFANLLQGKPARCVYEAVKPVHNGIEKEATIMFKEPAHINYVAIKTANCSIKEAYLILQNGSQVPIDTSESYVAETTATGLKIIMKSSDYQYTSRIINKTRQSNDGVWKSNYKGSEQ